MEKLKIGINAVIAISLMVIAFASITLEIDFITKKSWSFLANNGTYTMGSYPTLEVCLKDAAVYHKLENISHYALHSDDSFCKYR